MITRNQFSVTQKLAVTYVEIIKSRTVLDGVIKILTHGAVLNKFESDGNGYNYHNYYYQHESKRESRHKKKIG